MLEVGTRVGPAVGSSVGSSVGFAEGSGDTYTATSCLSKDALRGGGCVRGVGAEVGDSSTRKVPESPEYDWHDATRRNNVNELSHALPLLANS
jgi:hypothetical protein